MARAGEIESARRTLPEDNRIARVHLHCEGGAREDKIERARGGVVAREQPRVLGTERGEREQNARYFLLLLLLQLAQIVVRLNDRHRLDEERRARGGHPVDNAAHLALVFELDRDDIAPVARRHDLLLQKFRPLAGEKAREAVLHAIGENPLSPAQFEQSGRRVIGNEVGRGNSGGDLALKGGVRQEQGNVLAKRRGELLHSAKIGEQRGGRAQHPREREQLPGRQRRALAGPIERVGGVLHSSKRRSALLHFERERRRRLRLKPTDGVIIA